MFAKMLDRKVVVWGLLAIGLGAATAQAVPILDTVTLVPVFTYDFQARTAGANWDGDGIWGLSGDAGLAKVVADPLNGSNLVGQILPHTLTGTHYSGVFLNQSLLPAANMVSYQYNALSFKVLLPTGQNWDNWDKAVQVKFGNGAGGTGHLAYGTNLGTGFSIASELGVGKAQGSFGYGTSKSGGSYVAPGNAYHTSMQTPPAMAAYGSAQWHTMIMVMDRVNAKFEWYRDGVMFADRQITGPADPYAEWFYGNDLDPANPRWMEWIEFGAWGRYQSTTSQILFDDIVVSTPEPASLALLSLAALPLVTRRRRPAA